MHFHKKTKLKSLSASSYVQVKKNQEIQILECQSPPQYITFFEQVKTITIQSRNLGSYDFYFLNLVACKYLGCAVCNEGQPIRWNQCFLYFPFITFSNFDSGYNLCMPKVNLWFFEDQNSSTSIGCYIVIVADFIYFKLDRI